MANPNFQSTTTTDLTSGVSDRTIDSKTSEGGYGNKENRHNNANASKYYGYFHNVGEFRSAIKSYAIRILGWGYSCGDSETKVTLDHISGNGSDTFWSIMFNHLHVKKFNGDSYMQIIRDDDSDRTSTLINLKSLDPKRVTTITNEQGLIIRYEYSQGNGTIKNLKPEQVLHSVNNRILDEPLGTAETSAVEWVLEAVQEAERDWRRLMHRSSVRVLYVDEEDTTKQAKLKTELAVGISKGEILIIPCKPEDAKFQDLEVPAADAWVRYLNYLEGKFYSQLGISKVSIGGTTENNTEASAKVNIVITEPVWIKEITELENDLWNQIGIRIKINKAPSLMDNMQTDEAKNTGQTKLQYQGSQ